MSTSLADRVIADFPRVYFACHTRHVRDPKTRKQVSAYRPEGEPVWLFSVAALADGRRALVGTYTGAIQLCPLLPPIATASPIASNTASRPGDARGRSRRFSP